jgi:hypothetical protein
MLDEEDLVHHYCSMDVFISIIEKKEVWITALRDSNDSLEGQWVLDRFLALRSGSNDDYYEKAWHILRNAFRSGQNALGICFSEHRDLLSQWRGYADDGRGVSIGFSKAGLATLSREHARIQAVSTRFSAVEYWDRIPSDFLREFKVYCDSQKFSKGTRGIQISLDNLGLQNWIWRLNEIKNPAFREEAEHRLLSIISDSSFPNCRFRNVRGKLSPYMVLSFDQDIQIISKVTLGPKNNTHDEVALAFLNKNGFEHLRSVKRSRASYR